MFHSCSLRRHRRGGLLVGLLCLLVVAGVLGGVGYKYYVDQQADLDASQLITQVARRGPFDHVVTEQGEIDSSSKTEIVCQVKSRGTGGVSILWVIAEGTAVKPGEKLVELDSSELELRLKEERINVITATANVTTAKAVVEQAKIARQEYLEGVFLTEEKTILSEQAIAKQNLNTAKLAIQSSERLVAKGLVKSLQLEADRYAVSNAQNQLEAADAKLRVLRDLTRKKMLVQFDSDIEAALASLSATESELMEAEAEQREVEDQIAKCIMHAPSAGVVVYANKYSGRGGSSEFVVEAGATVRERQPIIYLPDPSQMQVECKINESRITLIEVGMPAKITVDAIPGLKLNGPSLEGQSICRTWRLDEFKHQRVCNLRRNYRSTRKHSYRHDCQCADLRRTVRQYRPDSDPRTVRTWRRIVFAEANGAPESLKRSRSNSVQRTTRRLASPKGLSENDRVVLNLREHLAFMDLPKIEQEDTSEFRKLNGSASPDPTVIWKSGGRVERET